MRAVHRSKLLLHAALLFLPGIVASGSVVFDWPSSPGWTAGVPNAGQTVTQSFTDGVSPSDITVSINNSGTNSQGMQWDGSNTGYPQISAAPLTGGTSLNALQIYMNKSQVTGAYIQTTVSFATAVTNLTIQIWDVDANAGQFVDKISNLQALAQGGGIVGADSVTSEVAGYNTISGSGLSTVVLGIANANNSTNQGTIDITFNGPVTQFSFQYSNNDPGLGAQAIALAEMTYSIVPEHNPSFFTAISCLAAILCERLLWQWRRSRGPRSVTRVTSQKIGHRLQERAREDSNFDLIQSL